VRGAALSWLARGGLLPVGLGLSSSAAGASGR
jgi:hypothetical protein